MEKCNMLLFAGILIPFSLPSHGVIVAVNKGRLHLLPF